MALARHYAKAGQRRRRKHQSAGRGRTTLTRHSRVDSQQPSWRLILLLLLLLLSIAPSLSQKNIHEGTLHETNS